MAKFLIAEEYIEAVRKKAERITRKAQKYGCSVTFAEVGEKFERVDDGTESGALVRFIEVEAEGVARVNGWEYVATVEHTAQGNIIKKALHDAEIPERYRATPPICEHCNTNRPRSFTYLVRSEAGEYKQVGKSCLKDYTGGLSVEQVALIASLRELGEAYDNYYPSGGAGAKSYYPTAQILAICAETVNRFGYTKADSPDPTKELATALYWLFGGYEWKLWEQERKELRKKCERVGFNEEGDTATACEAVAWLEQQEPYTDYIHNLKTATACEYVTIDKIGLLASLFPTYRRAKERERKEAQRAETVKNSAWGGKVGERITVKVARCECVASWANVFNGCLVEASLYRFEDENGNAYVWRTSSPLFLERGHDPEKVATITGTIKSLDEYKGEKQTTLTRCKLTFEQ